MKNRRLVLCSVLGLFSLCCLAACSQEEQQQEAPAAVFNALQPVCSSGTAVAGAGAYQSGPGTHSAAAFRVVEGEAVNINDSLPESWKPGTLGEAQLVVCLEPTEVLIETCEYDILGEGGEATGETGQVLRYRWEINVRLLEAQSGKLVSENMFEGGMPEECPDHPVFVTGVTTQTRTGESAGMSSIQEWLRPFIETP